MAAVFQHFAGGSEDGDDSGQAARAKDAMRSMLGPGQVDQMVRQAIQTCWMILPDERKNVDELEVQVRRLVDRAIRDLREDAAAFGLT
jgi:hypothetical protein